MAELLNLGVEKNTGSNPEFYRNFICSLKTVDKLRSLTYWKRHEIQCFGNPQGLKKCWTTDRLLEIKAI